MTYTYVVRSGSYLLGTSGNLSGAMTICKMRFEYFCSVRGIPTGSGGVKIPDVRETETNRIYPHWKFYQNMKPPVEYFDPSRYDFWTLYMSGLEAEFRGLPLQIVRFTDIESSYQDPYFERAAAHIDMTTGETDCEDCKRTQQLGRFLDTSKWPDLPTLREVFTWRVYSSCPTFRKQYADFPDFRIGF